jgi:TonB family protein
LNKEEHFDTMKITTSIKRKIKKVIYRLLFAILMGLVCIAYSGPLVTELLLANWNKIDAIIPQPAYFSIIMNDTSLLPELSIGYTETEECDLTFTEIPLPEVCPTLPEATKKDESNNEDLNTCIYIVEESAEPPNGYKGFYKFLMKNLKYPKKANRACKEGKVYIQATIETDGSVTNIKTVRGLGKDYDRAAEEVFKLSPKWKPGKQMGKVVKQSIIFPITFRSP